MRKEIIYCDKCGKQTDEGPRSLRLIGPCETLYECDLCPTCSDLLIAWIEQKEEAKKPKKATKIDHGKVMALHEAGWDNKQIAEEMRLEPNQISQVIWKEKNKHESAGD